MPACAASRYALGAGGVGAARPAPAASLISASRYSLGARRTALRACVPQAAQPLAAIYRRLALRARRRDSVQRLGPGRLYGSPVAASRCALGTKGVGAARPSAHMCSPGCARCLLGMLWWGCQRRRALCAARDARCNARFALLPRARVGGGLRHQHAQVCGGTLACYRSMCSVSRRGAPLQPERPTLRPGRPPAL